MDAFQREVLKEFAELQMENGDLNRQADKLRERVTQLETAVRILDQRNDQHNKVLTALTRFIRSLDELKVGD